MELEQRIDKMGKEYDKVVVIPDTHPPYTDDRALIKGVFQYIKDSKPDKVVMLGDHVDFYALSSFDKNPDRITGLQEEIDHLHWHLDELRKVHKGEIIYLEGNHEGRLVKYLKKHPEISSLRVFKSPYKLLDLGKFNIKYGRSWSHKGVLFKHGHIVRKHSGYTAKGELENEGTSGVSGHTHRMASHYITNRSGQHGWFEMGHLCDEDAAEYMEGKVPNWQKGFGEFIFDKKNKLWQMKQYMINNNSFITDLGTYHWRSNEVLIKPEGLQK